MLARVLLAGAVLVLVLSGLAMAQDPGIPDTCYLGDQGEAWVYPGGLICLPIYVAADEHIVGISVGFEYGFDGYDVHADSVSTFGTIMMDGGYLSLTGILFSLGGSNGINPDSAAIGGAGFGNGDELPIGRYMIAKVWFTATNPTSTFTLDTCWVAPGVTLYWGPLNAPEFIPQYVAGSLTLVPGPAEIYPQLPDSVIGNAASMITFEVGAVAGYGPASIALDSVINTGTGLVLPYVPASYGSNPLTVEWTPTYEEFGFFRFWFTATDAEMNTLAFSQLVNVYWVQPPCDVMHGDADCDNIVNVSDAVYIINYIFNQGPPPGCGDGL